MYNIEVWTPSNATSILLGHDRETYIAMTTNRELTKAITDKLSTRFVGRQLYYYAKLTSTMNMAREKASKGAPEGTVIIANQQTSGRGRLGRAWFSPQGNLALSLILKPRIENLTQLIMVASLAVVKAIKSVSDIDATIKWPNDVLVRDKKVCGILIESEVKGNAVHFAVLGIGINIDLDTTAFPEIAAIATSLTQESGSNISRAELTATLLTEIEKLYLEAQAGMPIHKEWRERMDTLGKWIEVKSGDAIERGKAEDVTENGNLILRHANDSITEILVGDVTVLKS
ncbi:MAG: biotin--[acetyl-CoA-carboxylase] ligase [Chloroflexi bacterium]|nr:biotin--[acetyl-CoA-carboxylase] ligase [Chloroflexota bacterium]MBM3153707.1 biotin--[acetyl-CoA-carboxylase] ligase [Chloroflexota bacterium]MBM3172849.1 biotin--[acetyl-CoA-carboxylase] ligase [Chloroflexota bacterium]MBM3174101.1 biotin--[acetyl-CoA-carboxylase] ligase [Chloroflexota bacterium]MBM4449823.1 biotin--[acetyl-CoA-carboxylase] ligase [Chloroflexota bacterium]